MRTVSVLVLAATAAWLTGGTALAGGVAELRLDAGAVAELLGAALPEPMDVDLPGLGPVSAGLGPVGPTAFVDGAIEAEIMLEVEPVGFASSVRLRFVPQVERRTGTARLVPDSARLPALPFDIDLAEWVRPAELPRSVRWELEMPGGDPLEVLCFVQGLEVEADRLRIDLGLVGGGTGSSSGSFSARRLRLEAATRPGTRVEAGRDRIPAGQPPR